MNKDKIYCVGCGRKTEGDADCGNCDHHNTYCYNCGHQVESGYDRCPKCRRENPSPFNGNSGASVGCIVWIVIIILIIVIFL